VTLRARRTPLCAAAVCIGLLPCFLSAHPAAQAAPSVQEWPLVTSETPLPLPDDFQCAAWSPDGTQIAAVEMRFKPSLHDPAELNASNRIWLVDAERGADGSERLLCEVPLPGFTSVVWPSGSYLYVVRNRVGASGVDLHGSLYRVRVSDGSIGEVMRWPSSVVIWGEDISPDGRYLALMVTGGVEIVDLAARTKSRKRIYGWRPQGGGGVSWTPDGKRLAFGRDKDICTISNTGTGLRTVCKDGRYPDWSPDGRWLLFRRVISAGRTPTGLEISPRVHAFVVRPDGTGEHSLAPNTPAETSHALWSPTGEKVLYGRTEWRMGICPIRWFVARLGPGGAPVAASPRTPDSPGAAGNVTGESLKALVENVRRIACPGAPGPVRPQSETWVPIVIGPGDGPAPVGGLAEEHEVLWQ